MRNKGLWTVSRAMLCALTLLSAVSTVRAQAPVYLFEQEPNNTVATANYLLGGPPGSGGMSVSGTLTLGDIDRFAFWVTPGPSVLQVQFSTTWLPDSLIGGATNWINVRFREVGSNSGATYGLASGTGISSPGNGSTVGGLYLLELWATTPNPANSSPIVGSQGTGSYTISNLIGVNGSIVSAALPEPTSAALLLPAATLLLFRRIARKRKQP